MPRRTSSKKMIRVGVVGIGRGRGFARSCTKELGLELVALCDTQEDRLREAGKELKVATYTDYDKFLAHDLDAVILANYFHQHAPLAIQALRAGKHVMSETIAAFTLAQCVQLVQAVEKSGRTYMFAENYPYMLHNQEMRRIYQSGRIGTFMYGEGEYVHPGKAEFWNSISPGVKHWRNWVPATYYSSHSLAPLMFITDTWPAKVNAFAMPFCPDDPLARRAPRVHDTASMIAVRMNTGAVCKLLQVGLRGEGIWSRVHGSTGQMENLRQGDRSMVRLRREQYDQRVTAPVDMTYLPRFPEHHDQAMRAGHGGGDFFMNYHFAQAIRTGRPPYLDVYRGTAMAAVAILAWRSALDDSNTYDVPDFRDKRTRARFAKDDWNPDPTCRRKTDPPCSILGDLKPTKQQLDFARKVWRRHGYLGD